MTKGVTPLSVLTEALTGLRAEAKCPVGIRIEEICVNVEAHDVEQGKGCVIETSTNACWREGRPQILDVIIHLNDVHEWSRERVADWVETLDVDLTFETP